MNKADVKCIRAALKAACARESEYFEELYIPDFEYSQKHNQRIYELKVECDKRIKSISLKRMIAFIIAASLVILALTGATIYIEPIKYWYQTQEIVGLYYKYQGELKDTIDSYILPTYIPEGFSRELTRQFYDIQIFSTYSPLNANGEHDLGHEISVCQRTRYAEIITPETLEIVNVGGIDVFRSNYIGREEEYDLIFIRDQYNVSISVKSVPWEEVEKVILSLRLFDDLPYQENVELFPDPNNP